ncbi:MAG: hypothetical protein A3A58_00825 [Candidatus Blackburnbacteria bacterium RIFCSPLOWO2_01_FULL_41_27]|uniref:ATP-grasp domain-containing protein n=2 Tax=Candidatus Blackburniibacteriota TaxID=1817898 RepID=A0A1G1V8M4_9BACT|nr:MAG: hypothetical protein A3F61_04220 [Candidatus Blackburnbacteria bacterium RIFCSPHIGHO2_12_FULL_41_13b]OGY13141.1 MAG: hypothetical protein A3A58_00825 [Candidatus Blackburnbacteria bacterium RIFCSPLOWO2_01_FULL_41_27]
MHLSSILGLNARFQLYSYPSNSRRGRKVAGSKLLTKRILRKAEIPIPEIYAKFTTQEDIYNFDWTKLPERFAFKPSRGLGGEGIVVVRKKATRHSSSGQVEWITTQRTRVGIEDLKLHGMDILEGAYSAGNVPDNAFIEEFVGRNKAFRRYAYRGTPDIRVIVYNKVPVMAMLRLPTRESSGRANIHQGALGVGVDIATGVTTHAVWHGNLIRFKPGSKRKLHGIKIPQWNRILEIATACSEPIGLGYLGVDVVLHPEKGPMVLEVNAEPGLEIQLANIAGLRRRLDRVEGLYVESTQQGVQIAKALFASSFAARVRAEAEGGKTVNIFEMIKIQGGQGQKIEVQAKVDSGAWRTSVDWTLAEKLGLLKESNILGTRKVRNPLGEERRPIIGLTFWLGGKKISTAAGVSFRGHLKKKVIIGRRDLTGFLVQPH